MEKPSLLTEEEREVLCRAELLKRVEKWEKWAGGSGRSLSQKRQKVQRPFIMERYRQRMIALRVAYHGWHFNGFATQPAFDNTIEDHLFAAMQKTRLIIDRTTADYSRGGRTDKGVSALANVIGIRVRSNGKSDLEEIDYVHTLNGVLPPGLKITGWSPAPDRSETQPKPFSARFDAAYRSYKYFFPKGNLDIASMRQAAAYFVGRHDFRNFCKVDSSQPKANYERLIYSSDVCRASSPAGSWAVEDEQTSKTQDSEHTIYEFRVCGQAFMWHQIRCMAAVLFRVGSGRETVRVVPEMLDQASQIFGSRQGKPNYKMAPESPLVLCECAYPPDLLAFRASKRAVARMDRDCVNSWAILACQSSIVREHLALNELCQHSLANENSNDFLRERELCLELGEAPKEKDKQLSKRKREAVSQSLTSTKKIR